MAHLAQLNIEVCQVCQANRWRWHSSKPLLASCLRFKWAKWVKWVNDFFHEMEESR